MQIFSDMSLTEVLLMTLKSQEQKTLTAKILWDLSIRKLWPNDFDMLLENYHVSDVQIIR